MWRYLAAWLAGSAIVVAGLAVSLDGDPDRPERLSAAAERASCRFYSDSERPTAAGVVLVYRPTLSGQEIARVRAVARRLEAPAVSSAGDPAPAEAVAVENGNERLGCPRVDARTEEAIVLFVLSSDLDR